MATTVKLDTKVKERLDKIKAQLLLQGIKLKQDELIEKLVTIAEAYPQLLLSEFPFKIDTATKERFMSISFDFGESSEDTINNDLYLRDD